MDRVSRRRFLAGVGITTAGVGVGAGLTAEQAKAADVDYSGETTTDEPLIHDENLSIDAASSASYYKGIVTSSDELRWEYLREEDGMLAGSLEQTEWDSQYLTIFGMVLPRDVGFNAGRSVREDDVLTMNLTVVSRGSASSERTIMHQITRVENSQNPPERLQVAVEY